VTDYKWAEKSRQGPISGNAVRSHNDTVEKVLAGIQGDGDSYRNVALKRIAAEFLGRERMAACFARPADWRKYP
jgi:hypothetical protein